MTEHMKIVNLTAEDVTILALDRATCLARIKASGAVAYVQMHQEFTGVIATNQAETGSVPCFRKIYSDAKGVPESEPGVVYIVNLQVRHAMPWRRDVFSPGETVYNSAKQPIGCVGLESN